MPKIYDNIDLLLTKGLNETLEVSQRADFCVGYFNLRGWKKVSSQIEKMEGLPVTEDEIEVTRICRLLVGMQKMPQDILRDSFIPEDERRPDQKRIFDWKKKLALEFKEQLTIGVPTEEDEQTLRLLSSQLKSGKVVVKLHLSYPLHAKLYLAHSLDKRVPIVGFLGSSNLTLAGLAKQGELNIDVLEQDAAVKLANWFDDRWNDRWCIDITQELAEIIDSSWAGENLVDPYLIYLKMVYHLSQEARAGLMEYKIPQVFKNELLPFQQAAVLIAAKKLQLRDGVMIGDVVGLGKTITACAISKLYEEETFTSTLIICPPNLKPMWNDYINRYDLKAVVISVGEVQKRLPELRRFKLVIIDESHNLRNDQGSRYRSIKSYLDENESKVVLLSATPYNKSFIDLSNQLRLFIADDKDLGIIPEKYISHLGGAIPFQSLHTDTFIRSIKAFERSHFSDDWRELMRLYMVRRTRSFIRDNYAKTDPLNNRQYLTFSDGSRSYFPDRKPVRVEYTFDPKDPTDQYARLYSEEIVNAINKLELPRYGLGNYLQDKPPFEPSEKEKVIIENLGRAGKRLVGFCRTGLFKRLESSGYSFLLSLKRHILRNYLFIYALQNSLPLPIGSAISQNLDEFIEDTDPDQQEIELDPISTFISSGDFISQAKQAYEMLNTPKIKKQLDWIRAELFSDQLMTSLIDDSQDLISILEKNKDWNPEEDRQLKALIKLIIKQHPEEKILIFTQFADTAGYLFRELLKAGVKNIEMATGDSENPTYLAWRFSPGSNRKPEFRGNDRELRILIATDVLSEGQNLQDAHIILNYDLPWAIIRLIQRAGRVDRIGQRAEKILCYSFLPEDGLEKIIKLRSRLSNRIQQNAEVVGSDEIFFDGDPVNLQDLYNEKSGILDEEADAEVDLSSMAYQIWKNAVDSDSSLAKKIAKLENVVYSTRKNNGEPNKEGVIVFTRTSDDNDVLAWLDSKGNLVTQSQLTILRAAATLPSEKAVHKLNNHHELVKKGIEIIRQEETKTGGTLGRKNGVKYRVYHRLNDFIKANEGTLFATEAVKRAVDDIYQYPLKEFARETLNRQMKAGISDSDLAFLTVSLREEDKLAITGEDDQPNREPQIICSLGLKNE